MTPPDDLLPPAVVDGIDALTFPPPTPDQLAAAMPIFGRDDQGTT